MMIWVVLMAVTLTILQMETTRTLGDGGSDKKSIQKERIEQPEHRKRDASSPPKRLTESSATSPDLEVTDSSVDSWTSDFAVERPNPRLSKNRTRAKTGREQLRTFFADRAREDAYQRTEAREHPHSVVFIGYAEGNRIEICSGSLVSDRWVLTAAHCLIDSKPYKIDIFAGIAIDIFTNIPKTLPPGSQRRVSREFVAHPGYDPEAPNVDFDLALAKVDPGFRLTEYVHPVDLAEAAWDHAGLRTCSLTAFGTVSDGRRSADDFIRKTQEMRVEKPCFCDAKLKRSLGRAAASRYICMRPRQDYGVCSGDSGGGLICDGRLTAVASMSFSLAGLRPCEPSGREANRSRPFPFRRPVGPGNQTGPVRQTRSDGTPNLCGDRDTMSVFQDVFPSLEWIKMSAVHFADGSSGGVSAEGTSWNFLIALLLCPCMKVLRQSEYDV